MPSSASIDIAVNGMDNASQVLGNVKQKIDGLKATVQNVGKAGKQATSIISAGFGAMNGSISGAVGAARGMTQAMAGMGVAMTTALPVAAGISAALFAIAKVVQANKDRTREAFESQTRALQDMASAAKEANAALEKQVVHRRKLAELQDELDEADAAQRARTKTSAIEEELAAARKALSEAQGVKAMADRAAANAVGKIGTGYWGRTFFGAFDSNKDAEKAAEEARKKSLEAARDIVAQTQRIAELEKQRELAVKGIGKAEKEIADAKEKEAATERKAAETRLQAMEDARRRYDEGVAAIRDRASAQYRSAALASLSGSVQAAIAGAGNMGVVEAARLSAITAGGSLRTSANGYTTSRGAEIRAEARARRREQFQEEVTKLLKDISEKSGFSADDLGIVA